ncbi:hypothetical protein [Neobacillus niacini]|uniref:hypothetical protein n=1 Tax=Neobacillus niacini TaxID=86668 RepID=UPI00203BE1B4|nr:hypothetical protein [Neobacillus niacini]MCM3692210.1 hypothetical protein [Neobacillus niacini]
MITVRELLEDTLNLLCLKYKSDISLGWDSTFVHFHLRKFGTVVKVHKVELRQYKNPEQLVNDMKEYIEPLTHPPITDFNDLRL